MKMCIDNGYENTPMEGGMNRKLEKGYVENGRWRFFISMNSVVAEFKYRFMRTWEAIL